MDTLFTTVLNVAGYSLAGVVVTQLMVEAILHPSSKEDKSQTRKFMSMVYCCMVAFVCIIAAAQWSVEHKSFVANEAAKAARMTTCLKLTDDVNAYGTIDEFFARRDKCELEFGKLPLVASGASVVWTN